MQCSRENAKPRARTRQNERHGRAAHTAGAGAPREMRPRRRRAALVIALGVVAALTAPAPVATASAPSEASRATVSGTSVGGTITGATTKAAKSPSRKTTTKLPAGPRVRAIPGRTTTTLRWGRTKGATRYLVELTTGTNPGTKKTRRITTSRTTIRVTGLRQSTTYKVRVSADRGVRTRPSRAITTRTSSKAASRVVARAVPAGADSIRVSWTRPARATSVTVAIAPTQAALADRGARVTINGISAWTTSMVVKVPARLRNRIGSTSGNPVYVRVTVYNSEHRWTHAATVAAYAGSPAVRGTAADRTKVATYNVQLPSITQHIPGRRWADRRLAVARAIARGKPDVVGLQETDMSFVEPGVRQYQDVERLVAPYGYAWATSAEQIDAIRTTVPRRSLGAHLIYRTATTELLDSGLTSLRNAAATYDPTTPWVDATGAIDPDRYATWALFRDRDSGREFYAASAHLKNGDDMATQVLRDVSAGGLDLFLRSLARSQGRPAAPVVILADLNSDDLRFPEGAHETFLAAGYVSSASAPRCDNMNVATVNSRSSGYPSRPTVVPFAGMRIDHILVRGGGGVARHTNQVVLTSKGTFDEGFRGSDHNLQLAEISLAPR